MTSRSGALIAQAWWGRAVHSKREQARTAPEAARVRPRVRWGIKASTGSDVAGAAAVLAATAALWTAFLAAVS